MHAWAIATAAMVAAGCGLVGTLLVVRRMSLLGDAISHAMLPGIVVAVLAGGRPGGLLVLVGAVVAALLTVWLTQVLRTEGGLAEDAGAGVAFTTLFALGVVMVTAAASRIDLDPACVLHGVLELVPFDTVPVLGVEVPRAFLTATAVFVLLAVAAIATWKMQVFTAFDTEAARAAGVPVAAVTTGLLIATSLATVAGFEAVGAILVVAMLVVPAATAELLSRRLHRIAVLAILLGVAAAGIGYLVAWWCNTSAAGMIAVVWPCGCALWVLGIVGPTLPLPHAAKAKAYNEDAHATGGITNRRSGRPITLPPPAPGVVSALVQAQSLVIADGHESIRIVRVEGDAPCLLGVRVGNHLQRLARAHVPDTHRLVGGTRGNHAAIGRGGHAQYPRRVPRHRGDLQAGAQLVQINVRIIRARDEVRAIGREGERAHVGRVPLKALRDELRLDVKHVHAALGCAARDVPAVGRHRDAHDKFVSARGHREEPLAARRAPHVDVPWLCA